MASLLQPIYGLFCCSDSAKGATCDYTNLTQRWRTAISPVRSLLKGRVKQLANQAVSTENPQDAIKAYLGRQTLG